MKRDLQALASREYDLVVVGGGIAGISVARDAALRGLTVALVEKHDFAYGSSGQAPGMIHGGIRCLQRLEVGRLRALSAERNALLKNAPQLVHAIPVAVPTYGRGRDGRSALHAGFGLYDLLTARRNDGIADPSRRLASSRTIGRDRVLEMFPGLPQERLTGAGIFTDAQAHHPARLAVALLRSAVDAGAQAANGVETTGLVRRGPTVRGVGVRARGTGDSFVIQGRTVVNAAGAWAARILEEGLGLVIDPPPVFARRISLTIDRRPTHRMGLALMDESRESSTPLSRSKHHLFVLPWRDQLVLGAWHRDHARGEQMVVTDQEVEGCVRDINEQYPGLHLHPSEVTGRQAALVLLERSGRGLRGPRDAFEGRLVDHSVVHGTRGMLSLVGATWRTARLDAERVVDLVMRQLGVDPRPAATLDSPVHGGDLRSLDEVVREAHEAALPWGLSWDRVSDLVHNHGTAYREVFDLAHADPNLAGFLPGTDVLKAEVVHAVRSEMAQTMDDLVHRRTSLGLGRVPESALEEAAFLMGRELGWSADASQREVASVIAASRGATQSVAEPQRI